LYGNAEAVFSINASNLSTGSVNLARIGTGTPTGIGNIVLATSPVLESTATIQGPLPTLVLQDTNGKSSFLHCNGNIASIRGGGVNSTTWTKIGDHWPLECNLDTNDVFVGGTLSASGDVAAYASDIRLKRDIHTISDDPLRDVHKIRGIRFEWNPDTPQPMSGYDVGLVAQEVLEVLPEAVGPAPFDHTVYGASISGESYLTIDSGNKVTALLVEAIKQLSRQVDSLKAFMTEEIKSRKTV